VSPLGSDLAKVGSLLLRSGSLSFKELTQKLSLSEKSIHSSLVLLTKHNLVRSWQSEFDQVTHFAIDDKELILRLSAPRYMIRLKHKYSQIHLEVLENIYMYGSLLKSEIVELT